MKTCLLVVSGTLAFALAGNVFAQDTQQSGAQARQLETQQDTQQQPPAGQAAILRDANMSAQATSDTSYGGAPDTRSAMSNTSRPRQCTGDSAQCDIFFGH